MKVHGEENIILEVDSQAALDWVKRDKITNRIKHINKKYHFIEQETAANNIMKHVRSDDLISDLLTKPLTKKKTIKHCNVLGLYYTYEPSYSHEEGL